MSILSVFNRISDFVQAFLTGKKCHVDETETIECIRLPIKDGYRKGLTVHVMECSECGRTYEHVNGDYEFCPRCGRRRSDVDE